jgi:hypothetical protein
MGRLTLNVLLSFAQFEREVIGERVRDKIAASKKKGMWMGGMPPLGYDVKENEGLKGSILGVTFRPVRTSLPIIAIIGSNDPSLEPMPTLLLVAAHTAETIAPSPALKISIRQFLFIPKMESHLRFALFLEQLDGVLAWVANQAALRWLHSDQRP